jgi:hypothetical protein
MEYDVPHTYTGYPEGLGYFAPVTSLGYAGITLTPLSLLDSVDHMTPEPDSNVPGSLSS